MADRVVVEVRRAPRKFPGLIFQLEWTRCGKRGCHCNVSEGHGPYWYSYVWSKRKLRMVSAYVGRVLPF